MNSLSSMPLHDTSDSPSAEISRLLNPSLSDDKHDQMSTDIGLDFGESESVLGSNYLGREGDVTDDLGLSVNPNFETALSCSPPTCFDSVSTSSTPVPSTSLSPGQKSEPITTIPSVSSAGSNQGFQILNTIQAAPAVVIGNVTAESLVSAVLNAKKTEGSSSNPVSVTPAAAGIWLLNTPPINLNPELLHLMKPLPITTSVRSREQEVHKTSEKPEADNVLGDAIFNKITQTLSGNVNVASSLQTGTHGVLTSHDAKEVHPNSFLRLEDILEKHNTQVNQDQNKSKDQQTERTELTRLERSDTSFSDLFTFQDIPVSDDMTTVSDNMTQQTKMTDSLLTHVTTLAPDQPILQCSSSEEYQEEEKSEQHQTESLLATTSALSLPASTLPLAASTLLASTLSASTSTLSASTSTSLSSLPTSLSSSSSLLTSAAPFVSNTGTTSSSIILPTKTSTTHEIKKSLPATLIIEGLSEDSQLVKELPSQNVPILPKGSQDTDMVPMKSEETSTPVVVHLFRDSEKEILYCQNIQTTLTEDLGHEMIEASMDESTDEEMEEETTESTSNAKLAEVVPTVARTRKKYQREPDKNKVYKCDLCNAKFDVIGNYTRHRKIHKIDTENSHHKCGHCGRAFLQRCDMKRHMLIHTKQEPHKCPTCGKGYIRKSDLVVHMRFHSKERPYKCTECTKEYFQSGDLKRHIRVAHSKEGMLSCGHCKKQYATETTLIRHMQTQHKDIILKSLNQKLLEENIKKSSETKEKSK